MNSDIEKLPKLLIERALISVSDKTGVVEFARKLHGLGIELISTGGTAAAMREAGLPVTDVSEITGFPECLDGRVKTLHPMIHGGILARPGISEHAETIAALGIRPIQLVVVNLYPFQQAVAAQPGDLEHAVENIDIGGPAMVRAAAKNFENVCIVTNPDQYGSFVQRLESGSGRIDGPLRASLARDAFRMTAEYDTFIAAHLSAATSPSDSLSSDTSHPGTSPSGTPSSETTASASVPSATASTGKAHSDADDLSLHEPLHQSLRYGENPHQSAGVYGTLSEYIDCFHGKELSYNNYLDIDAALQLGTDFQDTSDSLCAIFKHNLPCGVALASTSREAWDKAFATDTVSPFGGIVLFNKSLDLDAAQAVDEIFTEIILAPDFDDDALALLTKKANRRLIRVKRWADTSAAVIRSITGGYLRQQSDFGFASEKRDVVTRKKPDEEQLQTLEFAWRIVKHVKSNAIVFAKNRQTIGIGTGQPNRVTSSRIAVQNAERFGHSVDGSVLASDAFFPFADGVEEAGKAGASAIIQPGGSVRDEEVIQKADEYGMAMILTGSRHFRH
ncbi:bifunctional phosphoribosylaminoimidazolecarboxamide formyltransferase/IMP cyclohydrolase [Balneolales bacterium ANBcel1]|nr:bifunctional phosphoribosylaminoimidazolecarboxamide formyltransferase/IMP cyclohydrolase [Balneolales bacterium ANBcel1]